VTLNDPDLLRDRLDALSGRIDRRVSEMKQHGGFSGFRGAGMDDIRRRSEAIRRKLEAAIEAGRRWDAVRYEMERDLHSLSEDFASFEARLDAEAMK
jgi:50S ribosomal subunit-associated GTPase HflX